MADPQTTTSVFYLARMHRLEEVERENARLRATLLRLSAEPYPDDAARRALGRIYDEEG